MLPQLNITTDWQRLEVGLLHRRRLELRRHIRKSRQLTAETIELLGRMDEILKKFPLKP